MRTFIAIDFSEGIQQKLIALQERIRLRVPTLAWSKPGQMHLTVKFLGEIDDAIAPTIGEAIDEVVRRHRKFDLTIKGVGAFGPRDRVNVVWVGVKDSGQTLYKMQAELEDSLAAIGFPKEDRPFKPHLTLAGNKNPKQSQSLRKVIESESDFLVGREEVEWLTFYQSEIDRDGPTYVILSRHAFGGDPDPTGLLR